MDREKLIDFLDRHNLLRKHVKCDACGEVVQVNKDTLLYRCNRRHTKRIGHKRKEVRCTFNKGARVGTWFGGSVLSLEQILEITYIWATRNPLIKDIVHETGVSKATIIDWLSFCREVADDHCKKTVTILGGEGVIVEVDEAKFGRRKYNRGRLIEGQWVLGGIVRGTMDFFTLPVPDRSAATLQPHIKEWVVEGTTIHTDCWRGYNHLARHGYTHLTVNHSRGFVDPVTGCHTQNIERLWRDIRKELPRFGRIRDHFVGYLAEAHFKCMYPDRATCVHKFLQAIAELYPPKVYGPTP